MLISPKDQVIGLATQILLEWTGVLGADSFRLQVSELKDFSQRKVDRSNVKETSFMADNLEAGKTYYWRVRSTNKAGNSVYSEVWKFSTKTPLSVPIAPELVSPSVSSIVNHGDLNFKWKPVLFADRYHIQISKFSNFNQAIVFDKSNVNGVSIIFEDLDPGEIYFWRVRAINITGAGPYSAIWNFKTEPLTPLNIPILLSPVNGITHDNTSIIFRWNEVEEAESYELLISQDSTFEGSMHKIDQISEPQLILEVLNWERGIFGKSLLLGKDPQRHLMSGILQLLKIIKYLCPTPLPSISGFTQTPLRTSYIWNFLMQLKDLYILVLLIVKECLYTMVKQSIQEKISRSKSHKDYFMEFIYLKFKG